jgi:hypothetical protein
LSNVNLDSFCTSILNNPKLIGCFWNPPDLNYQPFLLNFAHTAQGQQAD